MQVISSDYRIPRLQDTFVTLSFFLSWYIDPVLKK